VEAAAQGSRGAFQADTYVHFYSPLCRPKIALALFYQLGCQPGEESETSPNGGDAGTIGDLKLAQSIAELKETVVFPSRKEH
jgi:hypothetical protein